MTRFAAALLGLGMSALGAILAISALLPWYSADLPNRSLSASGVEGSGELWMLPIFGAVILVCGIAVAAHVGSTTREWAGTLCAGAGICAALVGIRGMSFAHVEVTIQSGSETLSTGVAAGTLPVAAVSVGVALGALGVGLYVRRATRRAVGR